MPLTEGQFRDSIDALFNEHVRTDNNHALANSATAFQNLALHFIDVHAHDLLERVVFDQFKVASMLKRFYRDAYGVKHFTTSISELDRRGELSPALKELIRDFVPRLGIRINSPEPRKTRIAAAFSLWMATFRPTCLTSNPVIGHERVYRLDATINFWIATQFLRKYGQIQIGDPTRDHRDFQTRLKRIWHDFTFRDLNLSSLEFMYAFIFKPGLN